MRQERVGSRPGRRVTRPGKRAAAALAALVLSAPVFAATAWPLRVSQNGRYLEDQDGVPFPLIGDAPWTMIDALSPAQMDVYFNDRAAKGFTAIITMALSKYNGTDDYNGNTPFANGNGDWSVRNEAYWTTLDTLLDKAKAKGIVVLLAPAYLGFQCSGSHGWCPEIQSQSDAVMYNYGQFLGNRYRTQGNIIWVDGGDTNCSSYGVCSQVQNVKDGIESVTTAYLRTAHPTHGTYPSTVYSWINVRSVYGYDFENEYIPSYMKTEYQRAPTMPVFMIESSFEHERGSDIVDWASESLWSMLGGGMGANFGNYPIWHFASGWDGPDGIGSPGSYQQARIGDLLRSRAWWRFEPDYANTVVTAGRGSLSSTDYVPVSRTSDGETVMAYVPTGNQITVAMSKVSGSDARAWWFNPATGATTLIGTYPTSGTRDFTPPSPSYVLVIDDAASGLAAPGTTAYPYSGGGTEIPPAPTNLRVD